ncbi:pilus assembly protein PilM, partial [Candidatus Dependentiae bacterium]|nr:pilus assembly protein PilM [Candidatus Dependentiae bacterium]
DIDSVKILFCGLRKDSLEVYYYDNIPIDFKQNLSFENKLDLLVEKLSDIKKKICTNKYILISISDDILKSKNIIVPTVSNKKEQIETLQWAIRNEGIVTEENYIKYSVVRNKVDKSIKQTEYFITAIEKKNVQHIYNIIKNKSGFKPALLAPKEYSIYSYFSSLSNINEGEIVSIINFRNFNTYISILTKNGIIFNRNIPIGKHNLINLISEKMNITNEESEEMLDLLSSSSLENKNLSAKNQVITDFINRFSDNINRTFDFFSSKDHSRRLDRIVLGGFKPLMTFIEPKLSENFLNVTFQYLSDFLPVYPHEKAPEEIKNRLNKDVKNEIIEIAGLFKDKIHKHNSIPPYLNCLHPSSSIMMAFNILIVLIISCGIFMHLYNRDFSVKKQNLIKKNMELKKKMEIKSGDIKRAEKLRDQYAKKNSEIEEQIKMLEQVKINVINSELETRNFIKSANNYTKTLSALNAAASGSDAVSSNFSGTSKESIFEIYFEEISLNQDILFIKAFSKTKKSIMQFMNNIEKTNFFINISLTEITEKSINNITAYNFIISAEVRK